MDNKRMFPVPVNVIVQEAYEQGFHDGYAQAMSEMPDIVRCKDCKYWHSNTEFCGKWSVNCCAHRTSPDWYCADGERKEGDGE